MTLTIVGTPLKPVNHASCMIDASVDYGHRAGEVWRGQMIDVLVKGSGVAAGGSVQQADLAIRDRRIAGIVRRGLISEARRTVDAEGRLVLPGMVYSRFHCIGSGAGCGGP